ncbi:thiol-disulfide isomerase [Pseudomonas abyssi]|jgi:hypothetical protein|uniref:Thiol-disulfide isomerase n=2 Tax=Pseudomonas abyssi TaxID=170540 RepID=A0A2A3MIN9_9PSED|nr:thiol-disulfide isomerase [Pseudomonadales bacterium]PBK04688.1 thiol-disulfide isomerase [Pseudomonas abyssi]|tara:strand:- start:28109 stop:28708 length:600 start_codon:yes stop_codon:yes gene_type:complete
MNLWVRRLLVSLALLVWVAGLGWAYWWFEGRYIKSFERPVFFQAEQVAPPFAPGQVQVVHVWQSNCPCSAGHEAYVEEMTRRFAEQGVRFARSGQYPTSGMPAGLSNLPYWPIPQAWSGWPGAPSIAIWAADGSLAYVGPYSDGAHCSADSSFVEPVVQALLAGRKVNITRQDAVACLCDLPVVESSADVETGSRKSDP